MKPTVTAHLTLKSATDIPDPRIRRREQAYAMSAE